MIVTRWLLILIAVFLTNNTLAHPLRLSLCEIEYYSNKKILTVNLKLFLTDVNEALLFDSNSNELAFCQSNESLLANTLLMDYLNQFFYIKFNQKIIDLKIKKKRLGGEGQNTALWIYFEVKQETLIDSLEIKNAVFTDLFYDQNNIIYVHVDGESKSLMLNKKSPVLKLKF